MINTIDNSLILQENGELVGRLEKIRHIALDMDGTLYNGDTLYPFAKQFLQILGKLGITYSFLTNNPSRNAADYLSHLKKMGLTVSREMLYTSADATISYLRRNHPESKRLFILGTPSMIAGFEQAGFVSLADSPAEIPDAVVVGFDLTLSYDRLSRAAWWISKGKPYLATNPDLVCPTDQPVILVDCGSICAALEKATGRKPDVVPGKPNPGMLDGIINDKRLDNSEIAMVGDRIYTDMLMAYRAKVMGVLVLSGEATLKDAEESAFPIDLVTGHLGSLGNLLQSIHAKTNAIKVR